jgi:hypothetical protein
MGLSKWLMTHGIGSPGSIAKAMMTNYMELKKREPSLSQNQLFILTAKLRIDAEKRLGIINPFSLEEIVKTTKGDLKNMIMLFVMIESQNSIGLPQELPLKTQSLISEVISEVVDKYIR